MRLRHRYRPKPRDGERRQLRRFAVLPVRGDNEWIWLEWYTKHQAYDNWAGWFTIHRFPARAE